MSRFERFEWTEQNVVLLEEWVRAGLSASQIAAKFGGGITRNAVCGKVHRSKVLKALGMGGSGTKSEKCSQAAARSKKQEKVAKQNLRSGNIARKKTSRASDPGLPPPPIPAISSLEYEKDCLRLLIHELGPRQCRWEINNAPLGEDHLFCGKHADEGKPYCTHHCRKAYGLGTRSEQTSISRALNMHRRAA